MYFDFLNDIVDEYNNTHHKTIKMKPIDVKSDSFTEYNKESNKKDPKLKVGDYVRISKNKNIFAKGYAPNWSEEIFIVKKIKNTSPWTYLISDLDGEGIVGSFYEKELQKTNQKEFRIEKELYVKWKGYNNSFNNWIDNDLAKFSNVVKNDVVETTEYSELVTKVNNIDTAGFVLKTKYDPDKSDLENNIIDAEEKIPNTNVLVKKQIRVLKLLR